MDMPPEDTGAMKMDFRLNILSLANFIALIGILVTAISTWYNLASEVRMATADINNIKIQLNQSITERKNELDALRAKDEVIMDAVRITQERTSERLYSIDAKVQIMQNALGRVEQSLKKEPE